VGDQGTAENTGTDHKKRKRRKSFTPKKLKVQTGKGGTRGTEVGVKEAKIKESSYPGGSYR